MKAVIKNAPLYNLFLVFLIELIMIGCVAEIPNIDVEPPHFLFEITGDGFNHKFTEESDFANIQLNLKEGAAYNFTFNGGDHGGTKQIQWQYTTSLVQLETVVPSPWVVSNTGLSTFVNFFGDKLDPITGMFFAGTFRTRGDLQNHNFNFMVKDFGGAAAIENSIFKSLRIFSGDHPTEIIHF